VRDTAAHGGKSEGLQITRNGTRHDGTHHRADKTVTVDDVGEKPSEGDAARLSQETTKAAVRTGHETAGLN
jgi:hypothetical protein